MLLSSENKRDLIPLCNKFDFFSFFISASADVQTMFTCFRLEIFLNRVFVYEEAIASLSTAN